MKKKKALKKLLIKIEMQNKKILMDIEFIRQNLPVNLPYITTMPTPSIPSPIEWWSTYMESKP